MGWGVNQEGRLDISFAKHCFVDRIASRTLEYKFLNKEILFTSIKSLSKLSQFISLFCLGSLFGQGVNFGSTEKER